MHQYMYTCPPYPPCLVHPPIRGGSSNWRWELWLEVGAPIGGETTDQRWELQLEVRPLIWAPTSDQRSHLKLELSSLIGALTSNWRSQLQSEVSPPIGVPTSDQRSLLWLKLSPPIRGLTSYWRSHLLEVFFIPSWAIIILDYIKNKVLEYILYCDFSEYHDGQVVLWTCYWLIVGERKDLPH